MLNYSSQFLYRGCLYLNILVTVFFNFLSEFKIVDILEWLEDISAETFW